MYKEIIKKILRSRGEITTDPRHIEGYMRLAHSTLDHLSLRQFETEVTIGLECIREDGVENAEKLCLSMGL